MLRTSLAAAGIALALALPLHAQSPIRVGQTLNGQITASDPTLDDDSHFDLFSYRGQAGERVTFTLRSSDFDAVLAVGRMNGGEMEVLESDDDGAGGTDARVTVAFPAAGMYVIRANTLSAGETGAYTLTAAAAGEAPRIVPTGTIRAGQTVRGTLDASDPQADDSSYFDTWTYVGAAGQPVTITLRSSDFDAFLGWGRLAAGDWTSLESDDDGGGGTDSRLEVTPDGRGGYSIRVNTLGAGETGSYTLTVTEGGAGGAGNGGEAGTIAVGETVRGRLDESDPRADDESYFDAWTLEGRAGEQLRITLRSSEFDAYLNVGRGAGDDFESIQTDDDGDGGTDARVDITLPSTGRYVIRANTLTARETGAYTLTVARR
jgi:hypothetical protein